MNDEEPTGQSHCDQPTENSQVKVSTASFPPEIRLQLTMRPEQVREFFPILQQGVTVNARVGCSLSKLLCDQLALGRDYVVERITTIFLDGKATDDIDSAIVRDGSTIALSAAMPGLVGATMRRGGYYAAMRSGITHTESQRGSVDRIGTIRVKLFNILLSELGPGILKRGVVISASDLAGFLGSKTDPFWQGCTDALLNGMPVGPAFLFSGEPFVDGGTVRLTVNFKV